MCQHEASIRCSEVVGVPTVTLVFVEMSIEVTTVTLVFAEMPRRLKVRLDVIASGRLQHRIRMPRGGNSKGIADLCSDRVEDAFDLHRLPP